MNHRFLRLLSALTLLMSINSQAADLSDPGADQKPRLHKIANDGSELPASASLGFAAKDWACTRDGATGLIWEVKTTSGLRSQSHDYSWYSSKTATSSDQGTPNGGSCATKGRCDTEKFVADVNQQGLCGAHDWHLPTIDELSSIVDAQRANPAINLDYFPNTAVTGFWSSSNGANGSNNAWYLISSGGYADYYHKYSPLSVRLVRGGL